MIYGYIRVSTDTQDCENQKIGITDAAQKRGLQVDAWISDDGVSGTVDPVKRKLGKLMKKLKPGDTVIASEISRLGRNLFMIFKILEFFSQHKINLFTVKDGYELKDDITSTVIAFAFGMAAQIERDMISKRTKEALQNRRNKGIILGRPLGSGNKLKLDEHEAEIKNLLSKNVSLSAIGRIVGAHRITVASIIKKRGWDTEQMKNRQAKTRKHIEKLIVKNTKFHCLLSKQEIIDRYKTHYSLLKISEEMDVSHGAFLRWMRRTGIMDEIKALEQKRRDEIKSYQRQAAELNLSTKELKSFGLQNN
jgi:DNA invertase Pin-like site-specific DNA recombinase